MEDPQNLGLYYILEHDINNHREWRVQKCYSLALASHYCENNTPKNGCEFLIQYPNGIVYKLEKRK